MKGDEWTGDDDGRAGGGGDAWMRRRADRWPAIRAGLLTHPRPAPPSPASPTPSDPQFQPRGRPGWQGRQTPLGPRISSMVSSLTRTRRMGYTKGRMRLLKPQAPTCKGQDFSLGSPTTGPKLDCACVRACMCVRAHPQTRAPWHPHFLAGPLPSPLLPVPSVTHPWPIHIPNPDAPGCQSCPGCSCTQ